MDANLVIAACMFALVASITPGPNNLLLAASGLTFGFRRTVPLLLGIEAGFLMLLLAVAMGLGTAFARFPVLHSALKLAGTGYLLYLAWKIWHSSAYAEAATARPLGFTRGALFQLVNPKAWMMIVGAISAYTASGDAYWLSVAVIFLAFLCLGFPSITLWAAFGASFRQRLRDPRKATLVARILAALTAASCLLMYL